MEKAIKLAGVEPWPRLWHNLRSTRQTELEDHHPTHVVCAWLGNTPKIAQRNYLQVTDQHFADAVAKADDKPSPDDDGPKPIGVRRLVQESSGMDRNAPVSAPQNAKKPA